MSGRAHYQADEASKSSDGSWFMSGLHYWLGGNSKLYGAALFRLRETDFNAVRHVDGTDQSVLETWVNRTWKSTVSTSQAVKHLG